MIGILKELARVAVVLLAAVAVITCLCSTAEAGGCGRAQAIVAPVQMQAYAAPIQLQAVQAPVYAYAQPLAIQQGYTLQFQQQAYAAPIVLQARQRHHVQAAIVAPVVKLKPVRFPNLPRNQ